MVKDTAGSSPSSAGNIGLQCRANDSRLGRQKVTVLGTHSSSNLPMSARFCAGFKAVPSLQIQAWDSLSQRSPTTSVGSLVIPKHASDHVPNLCRGNEDFHIAASTGLSIIAFTIACPSQRLQ